jgi:hypothetical protein
LDSGITQRKRGFSWLFNPHNPEMMVMRIREFLTIP